MFRREYVNTEKVLYCLNLYSVIYLRSTIGERSPKLGVPVVTWGSCGQLSRDFAGVKNRDFLGGRAGDVQNLRHFEF